MEKTDDLKARRSHSYWSETDARRVLETWQQSGETLAGFARRVGVNRRRLTRWASRLRTRETHAIRFHPVQVRVNACEPGAAAIEIELGTPHRIRVASGFATEDLRRVLAVLAEGSSC